MSTFERLKSNNDLKEIIKTAFDTDLDISGSWGYTQELSTAINSTNTPLIQVEHIFASMRAYIEMNMTQAKEVRYGSINLNEILRKRISIDTQVYDQVTYKLTAMREDTYAKFINEYKEKYGKNDFDLSEHFKRREEATLSREVEHWFQIHKVI
ncbi:MAG: hypothetical protein L3J43_04780 [Sulfurovum sp.]|nr:hypothetical protein [Sulfurovum sp.]